MALRSAATRYGAVAIVLHWASAFAILVRLPLGLLMQGADGELRVGLYRAHLALGLVVLASTLLRVFWRLALERGLPAKPPGAGRPTKAAALAHGALHVALIALSVSGIGMIALSGAGSPLLEAGIAPAPGAFDALPPRALHGLAAAVLTALLAVHVAAALWHRRVARGAGAAQASVASTASARRRQSQPSATA